MFVERMGPGARIVALAVGLSGALAIVPSWASAAESTPKGTPAVPSDNYDEMFERYLREARDGGRQPNGDSWNWMNGLALDRRARQVNDLVTIRVVESITASGSADSSLSKNSQASASVPDLRPFVVAPPSPRRRGALRLAAVLLLAACSAGGGGSG